MISDDIKIKIREIRKYLESKEYKEIVKNIQEKIAVLEDEIFRMETDENKSYDLTKSLNDISISIIEQLGEIAGMLSNEAVKDLKSGIEKVILDIKHAIIYNIHNNNNIHRSSKIYTEADAKRFELRKWRDFIGYTDSSGVSVKGMIETYLDTVDPVISKDDDDYLDSYSTLMDNEYSIYSTLMDNEYRE